MTTRGTDNTIENNTKLSIQVSLNGLSFCILDVVQHTVIQAEQVIFAKKRTPYSLLNRLKQLFTEHKLALNQFSEVVVTHRNNLSAFVPLPLFDSDQLANYLKFNTKILADDHMAYDELEGFDMVNVYVPFVNINNYIYEHFGAFTFKHNGTVMVESLLNGHNHGKNPVCYVHVFERQMDIAILKENRLLLFNSFDFVTKEDFLYYLLFTLEQLQLDPNKLTVKLFGDIEEDDDIYELCYRYISNIAVIVPAFSDLTMVKDVEETLDFTVLNAL